jgi:GTPase SAR1 family protein
MFSLVHGIYKAITQRPQFNLLILGGASSGKTQFTITLKQMISLMSENGEKRDGFTDDSTLQPTVGLNVTKFSFQGCDVVVWDLGGKPELQSIWEDYYDDCHAVIILVNYDATDKNQVLSDVNLLQRLAKNKKLQMVPFMILTNWRGDHRIENKLFDSEFMHHMQQIIELRQHSDQPLFLKEANVKSGVGIFECFHHLIEYLKASGRIVNQKDFI